MIIIEIFERITSDVTHLAENSEVKHFSCKSLNFWWSLVALLFLLSGLTPAAALAFPSVDSAKLFYVAIGNLLLTITCKKLNNAMFHF